MTKISPGSILMMRTINDTVVDDIDFARFVHRSLHRHLTGDWGDLCAEDKRLNDEAAAQGGARIFSAYKQNDWKIWIITEADRSATTILFPDEY